MQAGPLCFDFLHLSPISAHRRFGDDRYAGEIFDRRRIFHDFSQGTRSRFGYVFSNLEDELIVHLHRETHLFSPIILLDELVAVHHGELDDIGLSSLDRSVHRHTLCLRDDSRER